MVYNEFGNLKSVIVGTELEFSKRAMDFTFRNMYKENLKLDSVYNNIFEYYELNYKLIQERIDDLNSLAKVLTDRGIKVNRPDIMKTPVYFEHDKHNIISSAASNVRDLCFTYGDYLIQTPVSVINRLNENQLFLNKIPDAGKGPGVILTMNNPKLDRIGTGIDTGSWENLKERIQTINTICPEEPILDTTVLDTNPLDTYEKFIDAANMIKINDDVICNIGSINQYLMIPDLKELFSQFYPKTTLHFVYVADSHIDGTLIPLTEGTFLANEKFLGTNKIKDALPEKFKNWDIIYAQDTYQKDREYWDELSKNPLALSSSRGMDINVLSLNRKEILINDDATRTADLLYKKGFQPVPIQFRHGEIFAGGIHCSTLDLERDQ